MKANKITKIMSLLISALTLASCGGLTAPHGDSTAAESESAPVTTQTPTSPADETVYLHSGNPDYPVWANAYLEALPDRDFNGSTFFISSPSTGLFDPSEIHYLSDVVTSRNKLVEEKYNIKIELSKVDSATMLEEAKKASLAGMYYTNIMCVPFAEIGAFDNAGLLTNLRSLPHLDLTMPYFNQSSVNALTAGYKTYGVAGEATPVTDLPCIIYNKAIAEEQGLDDLYDTALNGELTWDKLQQYMVSCETTENYTAAVLECGETLDHIFKSLGQQYIFSGEKKVPSTGIAVYSMNYAATYARYMLARASELGITKETAVQAFNEGKALFTVGKIGGLDRYRNTNVQIGILPMPKSDGESPYISAVSGNALIMTIPDKSTNSEMASLVLSAVNAASYGYISEAVVDYLHATALPDNRSADVLDIITRSAVYDFSMAFEQTLPTVATMKKYVRELIEVGDFTEFDTVIGNMNAELASSFPLGY